MTSNNLNGVLASWEKLPISANNIPSETGPAGAVVSQGSSLLVSVGGCSSSSSVGTSCADQDTFIIETGSDNINHPAGCPAPRIGGTLVPNMNQFSDAFGAQAFLLLGTFDTSTWTDGGGLERGEVVCPQIYCLAFNPLIAPIGCSQRRHRFALYFVSGGGDASDHGLLMQVNGLGFYPQAIPASPGNPLIPLHAKAPRRCLSPKP